MSEVVDDDVRLGGLNVPRLKASRISTVFRHKTARPLDLSVESRDLLRDWAHGDVGYFHSFAE